ncbi:MAG: homocitrate synthase/isopropylmalate synthase family protein [Desulfocucumaceae bacterium]
MDLEHGPWKKEKYWVSHYQFMPQVREGMNNPPAVEFHDSTLRDGEQAAGVFFSPGDKIEIAKLLDAAGIQYIEAGFPVVSKADREAIEKIVGLGLKAKITCLSRAKAEDIDLAAAIGVWGAILEIPVSQVRLKYQFGWTEDEAIKKILSACFMAKEKGLATYLFMIDSTRAELSFIEKLLTTTVGEGVVDRISVVDTAGCTTPGGMRYFAGKIRQMVDVPMEVHAHNDFGLGVANSLAAVEAGAASVAATLNGLGQRAGNASLEEIAWSLEALYGIPTGLDFARLYEVAIKVQELSGWSFPPNKAVVGRNIFNWEAGLPVAALRKNPHTVEPFQPEIFGRRHQIDLGKKCGKANIEWKIEELGLEAPDPALVDRLVSRVKEESVKLRRVLNDDEFIGIYREEKKG